MRAVWDTSDVSSREGFAYWRDSVTQAYLPLEPEAPSTKDFRGRIDRNGTTQITVSRVSSARSAILRTQSGISRRQNDSFFANLLLSGSALVSQGGRTERAQAGEVLIVDTNRPFSLEFGEGVDLICIAFDGTSVRRLADRTRGRADLVIRSAGAGKLVSSYAVALAADLDTVDAIADLAAEQFPALVARAAVPSATFTTKDANLAAEISNLIEAEIDDPDLGAKRISAVLGISRTLIYDVMSAQGLTLAGFIRNRRLRGCIDELVSADPKSTSIATIAERWGFRDPAAFSRTFKRITGETPSQYRRQFSHG